MLEWCVYSLICGLSESLFEFGQVRHLHVAQRGADRLGDFCRARMSFVRYHGNGNRICLHQHLLVVGLAVLCVKAHRLQLFADVA